MLGDPASFLTCAVAGTAPLALLPCPPPLQPISQAPQITELAYLSPPFCLPFALPLGDVAGALSSSSPAPHVAVVMGGLLQSLPSMPELCAALGVDGGELSGFHRGGRSMNDDALALGLFIELSPDASSAGADPADPAVGATGYTFLGVLHNDAPTALLDVPRGLLLPPVGVEMGGDGGSWSGGSLECWCRIGISVGRRTEAEHYLAAASPTPDQCRSSYGGGPSRCAGGDVLPLHDVAVKHVHSLHTFVQSFVRDDFNGPEHSGPLLRELVYLPAASWLPRWATKVQQTIMSTADRH